MYSVCPFWGEGSHTQVSQPDSGILQICFNETWGTVCDDLFEEADIVVVCRDLGYRARGAVSLHCDTIVLVLTHLTITSLRID